MSSAAPLRDHLRYLDGLRGVAIVMVLAIHASEAVTGLPGWARDLTFYGVRGLQLFFIISGYTLMLNHLGRPFQPADFATRRFFRIAPMFWGGVALYLLLARTTAMPLPTRAARWTDVAATLAFVHGWVPSAINTVVPGGWSIAAEAMFYLLFPALLWLAPRRWPFAAAVAATFVVAGATNVLLRRWLGPESELALYFWLVQLPAFAVGCWLATLVPRPGWRRVARVVLALALVGLVIDSQLRGRSNLLVAVLLLALLTWAAGAARPAWLEGRVLPLVGRISFSIYILHFAVLGALLPVACATEARFGAGAALAVTFAFLLALSGALAWLTFRWVERPGIALGRRLGRRSSAA